MIVDLINIEGRKVGGEKILKYLDEQLKGNNCVVVGVDIPSGIEEFWVASDTALYDGRGPTEFGKYDAGCFFFRGPTDDILRVKIWGKFIKLKPDKSRIVFDVNSSKVRNELDYSIFLDYLKINHPHYRRAFIMLKSGGLVK
ncbi:hypothetical protein HYV50_05980 [Candidatus Pacearchaeota archaeon]|nr:hypothetical protein [Candidatus Pacearchaeota archaeon]